MDKDAFLKVRLSERSLEIPGVGTVRVRGLTRGEAVEAKQCGEDVAALEQTIIHFGLVDPPLTLEEVAGWYAAAPAGEVDLIVNTIVEMSALDEGAQKSGVSEVRS